MSSSPVFLLLFASSLIASTTSRSLLLEAKPGQCLSGHKLINVVNGPWYRGVFGHYVHNCDNCPYKSRNLSEFYGCRQCDYDLCQACYNIMFKNQESSMQVKERAFMSEAGHALKYRQEMLYRVFSQSMFQFGEYRQHGAEILNLELAAFAYLRDAARFLLQQREDNMINVTRTIREHKDKQIKQRVRVPVLNDSHSTVNSPNTSEEAIKLLLQKQNNEPIDIKMGKSTIDESGSFVTYVIGFILCISASIALIVGANCCQKTVKQEPNDDCDVMPL